MTSAADLFGLQEIDLTRDTRRALIADVEARLGETEELAAAREAVEEAKVELAGLQRRQRETEGELEDLEAKLRKMEDRLYSGTVRNPKELTDLQREVDSLKKARSKLDDEGLAAMDSIEAATAKLSDARAGLADVESAWRADQREMQKEQQQAEHEIARLDEERQRRIAIIDGRTLAVYESLRSAKSGRAVARIERGACQGCRLGLPTHILQRARSASELVQCPSCERILVSG